MGTMEDNGVASKKSTMALSVHTVSYTWYVDREAIYLYHTFVIAVRAHCYPLYHIFVSLNGFKIL